MAFVKDRKSKAVVTRPVFNPRLAALMKEADDAYFGGSMTPERFADFHAKATELVGSGQSIPTAFYSLAKAEWLKGILTIAE